MASANTDEVFEADANAEIRADARARSHSRHPYPADKDRKPAIGAVDHSVYEETPLLEREANHSRDSNDGPPEDGSERDAPEWFGARDFEGKPWWKKPSIFWLLPPFLMATLALGGVIVPKVDLILDLICREYFAQQQMKDPNFCAMPVIFGADNPQCQVPAVQSLVSNFTLYGNVITGLLSAVTSPKLGSLSDRYGRTRMIALISTGMLTSEIITVLAARMPDTFSVYWLLIGFVCDGLSGSFVASMALTNAYVSDCTAPAKRNVAFGYFHGVLFTGIALGPLIGGFLVKLTGTLVSVFYYALVAHSFFALFVLLVVPESLTKERQLAAREKADVVEDDSNYPKSWTTQGKSLVRKSNILAPLRTLWPSGPGSSSAVRRNLVTLAAVDTIMFGVAMGSMTVVIIYSKYMFLWSTFQTSIFVSIVNICRVTNLVIFMPSLSRLVRGPRNRATIGKSGSDRLDLYIIRAAIFFDMLGYIGYAVVRLPNLFIVSGALASIGGMGSPTLQSALTKHVPPEQTGAVLGAAGLLHALARVVGPVIFNSIYSATVGKFTQTVFVCLASTFFLAFVLSWFIKPHVHWEDADPTSPSGENEPLREDESIR
ncbi:MAG: hypothetical protein LQ343_003554 [Gyalolechia ehrenbergii]|nr:MAG: hypothetical protein LQ343_003554 [Gyalolechia ehrenbergii]